MNRTILHIVTALLLAVTAARGSAQTPTSEEQLQEVVVLGKQNLKTLLRRGTRVPGAIALLTPDKVEHEMGSTMVVKRSTELKEVTLDIVSNSMEGAVLSVMIYRDSTFTEVLGNPLLAHIPQGKRQTIRIVPDTQILLEQGRYIITAALADCDLETKKQWAESDHWDDKRRYEMTTQCNIQLPLYSKKSYIRNGADEAFEQRSVNIGLKVKGI